MVTLMANAIQEKKVETSVKMYNSLDPSQVLTIEHLENLVNIPNAQPSSPIRAPKRPRMEEKENVPLDSSIVGQLKTLVSRQQLSGYQTRYAEFGLNLLSYSYQLVMLGNLCDCKNLY